jgi:hypothetical protein
MLDEKSGVTTWAVPNADDERSRCAGMGKVLGHGNTALFKEVQISDEDNGVG